MIAGLMVCALASSVPVLLAGFGVLLGCSTGIGYGTAVRVADTVGARRGRAVAPVVSAYAAGAVVLAPVAAWLLNTVERAGTFQVLAGLLGMALLEAAVLLPGASARAVSAPAPAGASMSPRAVPALWALFGLGSLPALVAFAHAGAFAGNPGLVVVAVAVLNAGNVLGRLAAGPLADVVGYPAALHGTAFVLLAALLALGAQYGALLLTPVATADAVPAGRFGASYGMVFSGWGAGRAGGARRGGGTRLARRAPRGDRGAGRSGAAGLGRGGVGTRRRRVPA